MSWKPKFGDWVVPTEEWLRENPTAVIEPFKITMITSIGGEPRYGGRSATLNFGGFTLQQITPANPPAAGSPAFYGPGLQPFNVDAILARLPQIKVHATIPKLWASPADIKFETPPPLATHAMRNMVIGIDFESTNPLASGSWLQVEHGNITCPNCGRGAYMGLETLECLDPENCFNEKADAVKTEEEEAEFDRLVREQMRKDTRMPDKVEERDHVRVRPWMSDKKRPKDAEPYCYMNEKIFVAESADHEAHHPTKEGAILEWRKAVIENELWERRMDEKADEEWEKTMKAR